MLATTTPACSAQQEQEDSGIQRGVGCAACCVCLLHVWSHFCTHVACLYQCSKVGWEQVVCWRSKAGAPNSCSARNQPHPRPNTKLRSLLLMPHAQQCCQEYSDVVVQSEAAAAPPKLVFEHAHTCCAASGACANQRRCCVCVCIDREVLVGEVVPL